MLARFPQSPSLRSFRHRAFRRMAAANLVSVTGTWMQTIALSWVVLELTGSTAALGGSVAIQAAPVIVFGLWGGAVVDRCDKRRMLLRTQMLLAALAAVLAVVSGGTALTLGTLYALALATGVVRVFDGPANATFAAEMVGPDDLANAVALGSVINSAGRVVGMSLGGIVIAVSGPGAVFWFNAVSYAGVTLALLTLGAGDLRTLDRAPQERQGVREGLAYLRTRPQLVTLLLLALVLSSFARNFQVTMAAMTEGTFGLGADAYGAVSTAFAVGALVGAAAASRLGRPTARVVLICAGLLAALEATAGLMPGLGTFSSVIVGIGAVAVVLDTAMATHAQLAVHEAFRGRVLAVFSMAGLAGSAVGAPVLGLLADSLGARAALLIGGSVAGGATVLAHGALRSDRMTASTTGREPWPGLAPATADPRDAVVPQRRPAAVH